MNIDFRKFVQLKTCNVRHCKLSNRMLCLCVKCANVRLLREALNRTVKESEKGRSQNRKWQTDE